MYGKNQQGNKTTNYPQIESRKILELKIEMSLNVTSAKWLGNALTNQTDQLTKLDGLRGDGCPESWWTLNSIVLIVQTHPKVVCIKAF